jgi:hypothetical protein
MATFWNPAGSRPGGARREDVVNGWPHERSNANLTADSWSPTLNNVTGQVINSACLTPSPTEQIALCVSGS